MKPDFLDEMGQVQEKKTSAGKVVGDNDKTSKDNNETSVLLFSCIMNKTPKDNSDKINSIVDTYSDSVVSPPITKIGNNLLIIGFSNEIFDIKIVRRVRRLLWALCNALNATYCTLTMKRADDSLYTIYFSRDELTIKEDYSKSEEFHSDMINERIEEFLNEYDPNSFSTFEYTRTDDAISENDNYELYSFKDLEQYNLNSIICHNDLLMINHDSDVELSENELKYIYKTLNKGKKEIQSSYISFPNDPLFSMLSFPSLLLDIPIILMKKTRSYQKHWGDINRPEYVPDGDVLGYYTRDDENFCKGPHIVISPENLTTTANETGIQFKILFAMTLVHELAHVMMDRYREVHGHKMLYDNKSKYWPSDIEAIAMEESLANMITLKWFEKYAPREKNKVKHFIDNWQSTIYRFGLWQSNIDANWEKWHVSSKDNNKKKLEKWFNTCFSAGNIKIPIENYKKENFDKVFPKKQKEK